MHLALQVVLHIPIGFSAFLSSIFCVQFIVFLLAFVDTLTNCTTLLTRSFLSSFSMLLTFSSKLLVHSILA